MGEKMNNNTPEKKFSTGAIVATVWQNQGKTRNGESADYRTVSFQRRYKDIDGKWKSTNSLRVNDLPRASLVLQKAYEYIVMKETNNNGSQIIAEEELIEEVI
jgi:hypothetical protein